MQLEGVDFFETYAPVVQWTMIRLMFILEVLLGLKSKQGDVTRAFLHTDLAPDEEHFVRENGSNSLATSASSAILASSASLSLLSSSALLVSI